MVLRWQRLQQRHVPWAAHITLSHSLTLSSLSLSHSPSSCLAAQISITFKNQQVLRDVSWEVKKGERVGLVGERHSLVAACAGRRPVGSMRRAAACWQHAGWRQGLWGARDWSNQGLPAAAAAATSTQQLKRAGQQPRAPTAAADGLRAPRTPVPLQASTAPARRRSCRL